MKKSIENGVSTIDDSVDNESIQPENESGFWNGNLDSETARHEAHKDQEMEYQRKIEELGTAELAKLREAGEIGVGELTPEKTKELIRSLGDKVFHDIAESERLEKQFKEDNRKETERRKQERDKWIKDLDDNTVGKKVGRFFKQMFTPRDKY